MNNLPTTNLIGKEDIIDRLACLIVVLCMLVLSSQKVLDHFHNSVHFLSFKALCEVISMIALMRLMAASVVRDLIDMSIYLLLFKMVLLAAYILSREAYIVLYETPAYFIEVTLYLLVLLRMIWVQRVVGVFVWSDWPPMGICGLLYGKGGRSAATTPWQYVVAATIMCFEVAIIIRGHDTVWLIVAPACAGLLLVLIYGHSFKTSVVESLTQQQQDAKTIEQLQKVIMNAHQAIKYLEEQQDPSAFDSADQTDTADRFDPADPSEPPDPSKPPTSRPKHLRRVK